jgi:hypothetical protein
MTAKSKKIIKLAASDVRKMIKELSLLVVSMDRIGSTDFDDQQQGDTEMRKYFQGVKAFRMLARMRAILSMAYDSQSTKAEVLNLEESCEKGPYWTRKKPTLRKTKK